MNTQIVNDQQLIAKCGLYCGACGKFVKEKCPGCSKNEKATWCQIRICCDTNEYKSCAECKEFSNAMDCKKYNNVFSKVIGFVLRSNRHACLTFIQEKGYENFATYMSENKLQSLKR